MNATFFGVIIVLGTPIVKIRLVRMIVSAGGDLKEMGRIVKVKNLIFQMS